MRRLAPLLVPGLLWAAPAPAEPEALRAELEALAKTVAEGRKAHRAAGKPAADYRPELPEGEFRARLAAETRPGQRQLLLVGLYAFALWRRQDPDAELKSLLRREVPSTAPAWSLDAGFLPRFLETCFPDPKEAEAFAAPGRETHPDPAVRAGLVMAQFEAALGEDETAAKAALLRLEKEFADRDDTKFARRMWDAQAKLPLGQALPPFSVPNLEDPKAVFTQETFKGKVVLIDFWASWCPPCRAELPGLHKAYARFRDRGFEVLSLSWDLKPEDIATFRRRPGLAMPWKHAYLGRGHELSERFGVVGIPKPVLVGRDGKILAVDSKLRGENLELTLEKALER